MAIFLNDGLGGGVSIVKAKINTLIVHADLTRYGFLINQSECSDLPQDYLAI